MKRLRRLATFLIAAWTGFYIMAIEILGGRILAPSFGSSIYVWGAVITVFMLALSLGYLVGGQISVYAPSLRKLGSILIAAGVAGIPVIAFGGPVLDWIFYTIHDPRYGSLLASALLFFLPTAISGMVSPYCVRLLVDELKMSGKYAGLLYFVSTFGSAAGTIVTAFYLVLLLEISQILSALVLISLAVGAVGLSLGRYESA